MNIDIQTANINTKSLTILIVDELPGRETTFGCYLIQSNIEPNLVWRVADTNEVLGLSQECAPDLILLNLGNTETDRTNFIADLRLQAGTYHLPPIAILHDIDGNDYRVESILTSESIDTSSIPGSSDMNMKQDQSGDSFGNFDSQSTTELSPIDRELSQSLLEQQQQQAILSQLAKRIRSAVDLQPILDIAVSEINQYLRTDRVIIYQFVPHEPGAIVAEAVNPAYRAALDERIVDTCFQSESGLETVTRYRQGLIRSFPDIYQAQLSDCHIALLERFQVKSCLVVPILLTRQHGENELPHLWGLAIAHQCDRPRQWHTSEISLLEHSAVQIAIAIEQTELLQTLKAQIASQEQVEQQLRERTQSQELLIQEFAQTSEILDRRNQDLDAFAAIASHDLRAPLRGIANLATWLIEDLADSLTPDNRQQFDLLQTRVQRMDALIEDLLAYARAGQRQATSVVVDVNQLLTQIIDSLAVDNEFTIEIATQMPSITTDRLALQQVFSNLIGNAVKHHHRPDGRVQINARPQADCYLFEIVDDGPGIAVADRERIFEVFQTLQPQQDLPSTGMGLAIVKKTVERHGGRIWVDSTIGVGSKFSFTWTT